MSGEIPVELDGLTKLRRLLAQRNDLSGAIPAGLLGDLTNLEWLNLSVNNLRSEIPSDLETLTKLKRLYLYGNELSGRYQRRCGA